jgi:transposase InsO family protein
MSWAGVPVGIGTRVMYDGELYTITDWLPQTTGTEVILTGPISACRLSLVALISGNRAQILPDGPGPESGDNATPAAIKLVGLTAEQTEQLRERAEHVREVVTGFRSGSEQIARPGEPRPRYAPSLPLMRKYAAKAAELGVDQRTVRRMVKDYLECGEAGLVTEWPAIRRRIDPRWTEAAEQIMIEHTYESKPSRAAVIFQTWKRLERLFGEGTVEEPSRATAYRELARLEDRHRIFGGTTKRNRDIAERPKQPYGKLRPTRPGEYVILDTTTLDVFALDPRTLKWTRVELTVAMDWYTRCVVALRLTPVSTKAIDAAAVMYQVMRPKPSCASWPAYAIWPEHGMPRGVLIDPDQFDRTGKGAASPALNPESIIVDHGKIYVSQHLTSVCQRLGISIQPARVRVGRDKGPLERFFRTVREGLLQYLPGYKGPDINARGLDVEDHAFFYIDELEAILREWVATVYHHTKHDSLFDPNMPKRRKMKLTPAQMFCHGVARAGYIEVPRDPKLAYEFLKVELRTVQHYGIQRDHLKYQPRPDDTSLVDLAAMQSPHRRKGKDLWPIHVDPDDVTRVYIRHPETRQWHELIWEHASEFPMAFSDEGWKYARRTVLDKHGFVDERVALDEMLTRHKLHMGDSPAERRIILRMSREDAALSHQAEPDEADLVRALPSVKRVLPQTGTPSSTEPNGWYDAEAGDDDSDDDLDDDYDVDELEWT